MLAIPNTTLQDDYDADTTFLGGPFAGGSIVIANNPAAVQLYTGGEGFRAEGPEIFCTPGIYPIGGGQPPRQLMGLRARNFIAGSACQMFGSLWYPYEAAMGSSSAFDSIIGASGTVENLVGLITQKSLTSAVSVNGTTEAAPATAIETDEVLYSGTTLVEVRACFFFQPIAASIGASLWRDSTNLGRIMFTNLFYPITFSYYDTPSAGNHRYSLRGWASGGSTGNILGGPGGSGQFMPATLSVFST